MITSYYNVLQLQEGLLAILPYIYTKWAIGKINLKETGTQQHFNNSFPTNSCQSSPVINWQNKLLPALLYYMTIIKLASASWSQNVLWWLQKYGTNQLKVKQHTRGTRTCHTCNMHNIQRKMQRHTRVVRMRGNACTSDVSIQ